MNKKLIYIATLTFLAACFAWMQYAVKSPEITTTSSLDVIEKELKDADESTFVVFDCDDVLIHQTDVVFAPENYRLVEKYIDDLVKQKPSVEKKMKKLKGIVYESVDQVLVDEHMPEVVKDLQERKVKVLVITSMRNEKLNEKYSIKLRQNELEKFGFDFSKTWSDLKGKWFGEKDKSQYYEFGIVCAKPGSKGEALKNFLEYSKFNPKKIVFIDDTLSHLKNVEKLAQKMKIAFKGFEYTASKKIPYEYKFSAERFMFQLKYLEKNEKWLSDKEAETMMSSK